MKLNLVVFRSSLNSGVSVEETHSELLGGLRKSFEVSLWAPGKEAGKGGVVIAFIASGGSENGFRDYYERLPKPLLLLTDGLANSLAAALEILSWVRETGGRAEILHGHADYLRSRIEAASTEATTRSALAAARIGVVGFPSEWLISSAVDYAAARKRWGSAFIDIELGVFDEYLRAVDGTAAEAAAAAFSRGAASIAEPSAKDIVAASRVYLALKKLAADYKLDAFTLKCFDILGRYETTGCMGLALLNQEGTVAGCEGDQRTVFTMLLAHALTGQIAFMANPSGIDVERGEAIFAHCTIAPCMTSGYSIRSHFESGIGVGIQGIVPEGKVTVLKLGGPSLDRYFVSAGKIVENLDDARRCRTQLRIELTEDASYFLRSPLSNHHVIVQGDHAEALTSFLEGEGATRSR
jgi:L-fucose isomerase-like protein